MNIKKQVIESIKAKLMSQQNKLKRDCELNAYKINQLAQENEIMKREQAKLGELIRSIDFDGR